MIPMEIPLHCYLMIGPWKINMEPKHGGLEHVCLFNLVMFRFHVDVQVCTDFLFCTIKDAGANKAD